MQVFWVTEMRMALDILDGGYLIRGNLRAPRETVFDLVDAGVKRLFGGMPCA